MLNKNKNCDGGRCNDRHGPVRVYPMSGKVTLILCRHCWDIENRYRRGVKGDPVNWPQIDWDMAKPPIGA